MHTSMKMDEETVKRIEFITDGTETPSQFIKKAAFERLKRMEARDIRSINQRELTVGNFLKPMIVKLLKEMKERGEL